MNEYGQDSKFKVASTGFQLAVYSLAQCKVSVQWLSREHFRQQLDALIIIYL